MNEGARRIGMLPGGDAELMAGRTLGVIGDGESVGAVPVRISRAPANLDVVVGEPRRR